MSKGGGSRPAIMGAKGIELLCSKDAKYQDSGQFWTCNFPSSKTNDLDKGKLKLFSF